MQLPSIFQSKTSEVQELLLRQGTIVHDMYETQLSELVRIINPSFSETELTKAVEKLTEKDESVYVYYPWKNTLVRTVKKDDFNTVRTNRNRELITTDEQSKLLQTSIAVLGMSIGSVIARTLVQSGISSFLTIGDHDSFDLSNLNRVPEGLTSIGEKKAVMCAQRIWELYPFLKINILDNGIDDTNADTLFMGANPAQLIIEETDDFVLKVKIRKLARQNRVPVLMATCLGDSVLLDVERFDVEPERPLFHGNITDQEVEAIEKGTISEEDKKRLAVLLVGKENVPPRAIQSVMEIGKTLVGRPQLFSSVSVAAGLVTFVAREILLGNEQPSTRKLVSFKAILG